jgi:oxalate---CoA ligase
MGMIKHPSTLFEILKTQAETNPANPALLAPGRSPLTFANLFSLIETSKTWLNSHGICRNDCLAIVLPNGPEIAAAFLAAACTAAAAPLNPSYRVNEFEFYLSDLDARAILLLKGDETPARQAAARHGIPVIELEPGGDQAGMFTLQTNAVLSAVTQGDPEEKDTALVLHTSGTTARPKIVPLSQANLCASAENISRSLQLSSADRCLNIMPLFHIHGLAACLLASLASGSSVVCTPGFLSPEFFNWVSDFHPTWYSAVPTMHQSILGRAPQKQQVIADNPLRFIRSCSAPLPPQVMTELEGTFHAPLIEAFGMTEAAHQVASSPLPPAKRKPGSVGIAAGPQAAVMAMESEDMMPPGAIGELVIRGRNVTTGYANNPEANAKASTSQGWFRTGDQAYIDEEGYFYITGRIKEIIIRGGEKISPREVDEVLLDHPGVKQAAAFAIPDAMLGEDVAAAVVLSDPAVTEQELRVFASKKLADHKVPRRILILDEIPKGPTGKVQRVGLAEKLGLTAASADRSETIPQSEATTLTPMQKMLTGLWCSVLKIPKIKVNQTFLELGGDSILAARLVRLIEDQLGVQISLLEFFDLATIAQQAKLLEKRFIKG